MILFNDKRNRIKNQFPGPSRPLHSLVHDELREDQIAFVEHWIVVQVADRFVHQRMRAYKVHHIVLQTHRVIHALARPLFRHLRVEHRQPGRVRRGLFFEFTCRGEVNDRKISIGNKETETHLRTPPECRLCHSCRRQSPRVRWCSS